MQTPNATSGQSPTPGLSIQAAVARLLAEWSTGSDPPGVGSEEDMDILAAGELRGPVLSMGCYDKDLGPPRGPPSQNHPKHGQAQLAPLATTSLPFSATLKGGLLEQKASLPQMKQA